MLPAEREQASFGISELRSIMCAGNDVRREKEKLFSGAPFDDTANDVFLSYQDLFVKKSERSAAAIQIMRGNPQFMADYIEKKEPIQAMSSTSGIEMHFIMFLTYIETQGTPEQIEKWAPRARRGDFFGAYAQTELGHGSNVRALETTATLDLKTREWVIHSPYLSSMKFWPTGMYGCTHGMVFAQTIIKGRDYGLNGFLVQFRDDTGNLMAGVEVGEVGPKLSGECVNLGYARFTHVRVPHDHLFARGVSVDPDGTYRGGSPKLARFKYISMMESRAGLVTVAAQSLAKAATIAVRYSCVRCQGFKDSKSANASEEGEHTVMDYQFQQYRLFKALALAYTFHWSGKFVDDYLQRVKSAITQVATTHGRSSDVDAASEELPDLHATLAGLKATCTVWAHNLMEDCRKACGGQGFLLSNGLAEMTRTFSEHVTAEGEQVILSLQVARFLIKAIAAVNAGQPLKSSSAKYLSEALLSAITPEYFTGGSIHQSLELLRDRSARFARELHAAFTAEERVGRTFDEALNSNAVLSYKASECHSLYIMAKNFVDAIESSIPDQNVRAAMERLFELMVMQQVVENPGDWIDLLDSKLVAHARARVAVLLVDIRPDAVALVDGFGISDEQLNKSSTLGRYDGNVYEAIYAEARRCPLNQNSKMVGWEKFEPVLDLNILREGMRIQRQGEEVTSKL